MEKFIAGIVVALGGSLAIMSLMLVISIIGALFGAFSGWAVSLFMPNWVTGGLALIGVKVAPDQLYLLGAGLGWFGSFFRATLRNSGDKA